MARLIAAIDCNRGETAKSERAADTSRISRARVLFPSRKIDSNGFQFATVSPCKSGADRSSIEGDRLILWIIDADEFLERLKVTLHQRAFVAHLVMQLHVCRTVNGTSNGCDPDDRLVTHARDSSSASMTDFTPFASFYTSRFSCLSTRKRTPETFEEFPGLRDLKKGLLDKQQIGPRKANVHSTVKFVPNIPISRDEAESENHLSQRGLLSVAAPTSSGSEKLFFTGWHPPQE
ncbi:hypothetical protein ALC62_05397 [Cyphomyrmex costatus]|uniref:Uncharacterized protein n=1 Tax=Cyphomyrmex costatus TaxID=456900 RepID=A0A195CSN4_9HYME|nr:hypothetical protein ALC62_05397 [Cyphomyrmex costatus]